MATLDELVGLPGAMAAFSFLSGGKLLDHRINNQELFSTASLELLAQMCAANLAIAGMQASGWERRGEMEGFLPLHQFGLLGLEWSVVVSAPTRDAPPDKPLLGAVIHNDKGDFQALSDALAP